jgi:hypothetical protein
VPTSDKNNTRVLRSMTSGSNFSNNNFPTITQTQISNHIPAQIIQNNKTIALRTSSLGHGRSGKTLLCELLRLMFSIKIWTFLERNSYFTG